MNFSRMSIFVVAAMIFSSSASAVSIRFCLRGPADFIDSEDQGSVQRRLTNGTAEHYWNDPDDYQYYRGGWVKITRTGTPFTTLWSGYLGDGVGTGTAGCSGYFNVTNETSDSYSIEIRPEGRVQGNTIDVDHLSGITASLTHVIGRTAGLETYDFDSSSSRLHQAYRVYNAAAFALYRHAGGVYNAFYPIRTGYDGSNGSHYDDGGDETVYLTNGAAARKFYIVHELAHALFDRTISWSYGFAGDSSLNMGTCPSGTGANHKMGTGEHQSSAFVEGLAHFYSADVWNNHSSSGCVFQYYTDVVKTCNASEDSDSDGIADRHPSVDCEVSSNDLSSPQQSKLIVVQPGPPPLMFCQASEAFPLRFLETRCSAASDTGVEVDWLRLFWDMHTDSSGYTAIPFNTMVSWINNSQYHFESTRYANLDHEANNIGGTFDGSWSNFAPLNGVDHP